MFIPPCQNMRMPSEYIPSCVNIPERLLKALEGEQDAGRYYEKLIGMASSEQDKNIISEFLSDEKKHFKNFRKLYIQFTGQEPKLPKPKEPKISGYINGIRNAIIDETTAYEFYRDTYLCTTNPIVKEIFFEAFTDENQHAVRLNYLFTKNK